MLFVTASFTLNQLVLASLVKFLLLQIYRTSGIIGFELLQIYISQSLTYREIFIVFTVKNGFGLKSKFCWLRDSELGQCLCNYQ